MSTDKPVDKPVESVDPKPVEKIPPKGTEQPIADAAREYLEALAACEALVEKNVRPDSREGISAAAREEMARRELRALVDGLPALPLIRGDPTNRAQMQPHQDDTVAALGIVTQVAGSISKDNTWIVNLIEAALDRARRAGWAAHERAVAVK
jgi:hypothetical protein